MHDNAKIRAARGGHHGWRRAATDASLVSDIHTTAISTIATTASSATPAAAATTTSSTTPKAVTPSSSLVTSVSASSSPTPGGLLGLTTVVVSDVVPTLVGISTPGSVVSSSTKSTSDSSTAKGATPSTVKGETSSIAPGIAPSDSSVHAVSASGASRSGASASLSTMSVTLSGSTSSSASPTPSPSTSGGLGGAATAGIVLACIFAGCAILIFVIRKTFIARRKRKRNTWGAGMFPELDDQYSDPSVIDPPPVPEKSPAPRTPVWAPPRPSTENPGSPYYVTPPPMAYNHSMDAAGSLASGAMLSPRTVSSAAETAIVRQVYVPSLPDELSITAGEVVQVVKAFDDGWGLCQNFLGEQGVVPLECLDRGMSQGSHLSVAYGQQDGGIDCRNMKRMSSLSTQQPQN